MVIRVIASSVGERMIHLHVRVESICCCFLKYCRPDPSDHRDRRLRDGPNRYPRDNSTSPRIRSPEEKTGLLNVPLPFPVWITTVLEENVTTSKNPSSSRSPDFKSWGKLRHCSQLVHALPQTYHHLAPNRLLAFSIRLDVHRRRQDRSCRSRQNLQQ